MIRLKAWLSALLLLSASHTYSETTGDVLDPASISGSYTPCGVSPNCWAGTSGGQTPSWNGGTARWGYGGGSLAWTTAINQALAEAGLQLDGYQYEWVVKNYNANYGPNQPGTTPDHLLIDLRIYDSAGEQVYFKRFDYSYFIPDWTTFTGTEYLDQPLPAIDLSNLTVTALGDDHGYWAGWYGPEFNVSASSINLIYSIDPLSSPTCSGYAEAIAEMLLEQQQAIQASLPVQETTSVVQTTPTEDPTTTSVSIQPTVVSGGTSPNGTSPEDTGSVSVEETADKDDDKKEKLDLARSLDAANNFDVSSVSGAPSSMEDQAAMDVVSSVEQQVIGGTLGGLENIESQAIGGLGGIQTQSQSNMAGAQANTESRQERRERLKELVEQKANEVAESTTEAEDMDAQAQAQMEQLALMNYVPGFDTYQTTIPGGYYPDAEFYKPQQLPNSRKGLRNGLAQQILHEQMVRMQYERGQ
jgi:hypothetical protein